MPTTDLKLTDKGSLPKPGPLGRLLRLGLAYLVLRGFVYEIWDDRVMLTAGEFEPYDLIANALLVGLFLVSYVINIGFSRSFKKWPALVSAVGLGLLALYDYSNTGNWTGFAFGTGFFLWSMYIFTHLGVSFLIAAVIGTPGCEMRAFHDLFSKISKVEVKEHLCPVGPIQPLDRWESKQAWMKAN